MIVNWSDTGLPGASIQFSADAMPAVIRTEMDNGSARQRPRFSSILRQYKASWTFTRAQYITFMAWHKDTIFSGADSFNMVSDLTPSGTLTVRFLNGAYSTNVLSHQFVQVSATLESVVAPASPPVTEE